MFRLTRSASRSLSRSRKSSSKILATKPISSPLSRQNRYVRQFSDNVGNKSEGGYNVFNLIGAGIVGGGVTFMYFKTKDFQNNTSAVNSALENYNKLQSLIESDSGSDDGGESAPVVLTEAPAAIEETIVEDDLAHVLEPTSQQKDSEINETEDLDKTLPIDEVVEDDSTPSNLVEDKLSESIIEDTHLEDDSDAHLVHQKLHENILESTNEPEEEAEKKITIEEKLHENIVEETVLLDDADAHLVHQKLHDDILDKAEGDETSSNVKENLHKDIVSSVDEKVVEEILEKKIEQEVVEEAKVEEVVVEEETKVEEVKVEEPKVEEAKVEEVKVEEVKIEEVKAEPEKIKETKIEEAKTEETPAVQETSNDEKPDIELSPIPEDLEQPKIEVDPNALPEFVPYVIVGGGAAAFAAMRSITGSDPGTKVLILTEEEYAPYQRPPLSKEFWLTGDTLKAAESLQFESWNGKMRSLYMDDEWHYAAPGELMHYEGTKVGLAVNSRVSHLDTKNSTAVLADGRKVKYGKCLVATGGKPKKVKELNSIDQNKITYYRTLNDFKKLEKQVREDFPGKKVVVIGGGFLGSELAVAMGDASKKGENFTVNQIIKEEGNLGFILPDYLSKWTKGKVEECGVQITSNARVVNATQNPESGSVRLELSDDTCVECDHVVAAVGLEIDETFAEKSGLEWDEKRGGMVVNSELQAKKNVWIAGDATSFHDPKLGRRRVEHHDHAVVTGRLAGTNMASEEALSYWHQSMYWSDLGPEVGFEAIGLTDCKTLKTLGCFKKATSADTPKAREEMKDGGEVAGDDSKDYGKGVVFYLNKFDRVVGVVSWNLFGKMKRARKIISDGIIVESEEDLDELAKLFFPKKKKKQVKKPVEEVKKEEVAELKPEVTVFENVTKVDEVAAEPVAAVTEPVSEPVAPVSEPVEPVSEPVAPVSEPVAPVSEPVAPVAEPVVTPVVEPISEPVAPTEPSKPEEPIKTAEPVSSIPSETDKNTEKPQEPSS